MSGIIDTVGSKSGIVGSDVYPAGHIVKTSAQTTGTNFTTLTDSETVETVNPTVVTASFTPTYDDSDVVLFCKHMAMMTNSSNDYGFTLY